MSITYLLIPQGTVLLSEPREPRRKWVAPSDYIAEVWQEVGHSHLWVDLVRQHYGPTWGSFDYVLGPEHLCYVVVTFGDRSFTRCVAGNVNDAVSVFDRLAAGLRRSFDEWSELCVVTAVGKKTRRGNESFTLSVATLRARVWNS